MLDREGYEQDPSPPLLATAAELLLHVLLAGAFGSPVEPVIRTWVATGRIPVAPPAGAVSIPPPTT
ncbi:hypothetical protein ACFWTC_24360 [Streptomyces sp. NPDC058619]|uniref:hypothetical protein n=1 Tax=unclassified Streptomyces TaxID=2593676 RepID=UPI00366587C2